MPTDSDHANNGLHPASAMQANTLDHQVNREHHGLHSHIYQRVHNSTVSSAFDLFPVIIFPRPQTTQSTLCFPLIRSANLARPLDAKILETGLPTYHNSKPQLHHLRSSSWHRSCLIL